MHRSVVSYLGPALATLATLSLGTAGAVTYAQAPTAQAPTAQSATPAAMNFQQVVERVVAQGYNDVREVERKSDKLYEVTARDGQARWVELYVDSRSGEILRLEIKR